MPRQAPGVQVPDFRSHLAFAAWREASEALRKDADAALPA